MSLISLYSLFFAIAIGALAPTEARLVPAASPAEATVAESSVLLADQAHRKNDSVLIQRERPGDSRQQKKSSVAKVLTKAALTAGVLALLVLFFRGAKDYFQKAKELKTLEEDVKREDRWKDKSEEDIRKEAERRFKRIREIITQKGDEWKDYTWEEKLDSAWREENAERGWEEFDENK